MKHKADFPSIEVQIAKQNVIQANYDHMTELEKLHELHPEPVLEPSECPHPEWLGVWAQVLKGISMAIKVEWDHCRFKVTDNKSGQQTNEDGVFYNPTLLGWEMIEPAPLEARAHTKPRPTVNAGWDPYDLG